MKDDNLYIQHILEAIEKVERFVNRMNFDEFAKNELTQSAVLRELGVIGEASKKLSEEFKKNHDRVPWKQIMGMRDKLIHDYFEIDTEAIWQTTQEDLPFLKQELSQ